MACRVNPAFLKIRLNTLWEKLKEHPVAFMYGEEILALHAVFSYSGEPANPVDMDALGLLESAVNRLHGVAKEILEK